MASHREPSVVDTCKLNGTVKNNALKNLLRFMFAFLCSCLTRPCLCSRSVAADRGAIISHAFALASRAESIHCTVCTGRLSRNTTTTIVANAFIGSAFELPVCPVRLCRSKRLCRSLPRLAAARKGAQHSSRLLACWTALLSVAAWPHRFLGRARRRGLQFASGANSRRH